MSTSLIRRHTTALSIAALTMFFFACLCICGLAVLTQRGSSAAENEPATDDSVPLSAAALDGAVKAINDEATQLSKAHDSEKIEQLRRKRWGDIALSGDQGLDRDSIWLKAYAAIQAADGKQFISDDDDNAEVGLVNELRYKEAYNNLDLAWNDMVAIKDGFVLGEVAVRMFEVSQQAKSVYQDALDPGSPNQVTTRAAIIEALKIADKRDPCCILARALVLYLERPEPSEAFLRAESREDFKRRQQSLVEISHPLILPHGHKAEHGEAAVLPWHAAVELGKAKSLDYLLRDLEYAKPLTSDFIKKKYGLSTYIIPGEILSGTDAFKHPFQFFQGRTLIGKKIDENGLPRAAVMYLNDKRQWDYRYLDLLWRDPTDDQLLSSPALRTKQELVSTHAPRSALTLGRQSYHIYDYPIRQTTQLIQEDAQVFCVRRIDDLTKLRFIKNKNKQDALVKIRSSFEPVVRTTPFVWASIYATLQENDVTKHPLNELMENNLFNPLVIVSDRDKSSGSPYLLQGRPGDTPYLELDNGRQLRIAVEGVEQSPCCFIEFDGATCYMPMSVDAVPAAMLVGTPVGKAFVGVLQDAGYTEAEALKYIRDVLSDPTLPVPTKFLAMLKARSRSQGQSPDSIFAAMLAEKGWVGSRRLNDKLQELFFVYGFRYLRDLRGNWIWNKELAEEAGEGATAVNEVKAADAAITDYPLEFRARDGRQRINTSQIYSWPDYEQLKKSIPAEHLSKVLMFHPCLPVLDLYASDAAVKLTHPTDLQPDYLKNKVSAWVNNEQGLSAGRPTEEKGLTDPYAAWMFPGEEEAGLQARTLSSLHLSLYGMVTRSASNNSEIIQAANLLRLVKAVMLFTDDQKTKDEFQKIASDVTKRYEAAVGSRQKYMEPLLAVQLESARYYADIGWFHKSLVFYNDFLAELYPVDPEQPEGSLFDKVPTTERMQAYVGEMDKTIDMQMLLLNTQIEMAGVLNASGLRTSAMYVWQRSVDDFDFFLAPSLRLAEDLLVSYGLRLSERAQREIAEMKEAVQLARDAIARYDLEHNWRAIDGLAGMNDAREVVRNRIRQVRRILDHDAEGALSAEDDAKLIVELQELPRDEGLQFEEWVQLKNAVMQRPALVFRTNDFMPPWCACPVSYSESSGFQDGVTSAIELLKTVDVKAVVDWCKKPLLQANTEAIAARASFLVGWYQMERNERALGRAAFMNLARIQFSGARAEGKNTAGLVHEFNAFTALTTASAVAEAMPGISSYKTDFSDFLDSQLTDWEKRWFSIGNYGPHASEQRLELESRVWHAVNSIGRSSAKWRNDRYFFPDYTFNWGCVPDSVVNKLLVTPELFKALSAEELAAKEKNATEGGGWVHIEKSDADQYFEKQKLDGKINKEIVFLGD